MAWLVGGAVALVLALVFGLLARRDRKEGDRAIARVEDAETAAREADRQADALSAAPLSGSDAADVLDRLSDD